MNRLHNLFDGNVTATAPLRARIVACAVAFAVYLILFVVFYSRVGPNLTTLIGFPVLLTAWLFPLRTALAVYAIGVILNAALYVLIDLDGAWSSQAVIASRNLPGLVLLLIFVVLLSALRNLTLKLRHEVHERHLAQITVQRHADRLRVLRQIEQAILATQSVTNTAQTAADETRRLLGCQRVSVTYYDHSKKNNVWLAVSSATPTTVSAGTRVPMNESVRALLATGRPHRVDELLVVREPTQIDEQLITEGIRSYANVPMIVSGQLVGALNLSSAHPAAFSEEDLAVAGEIADQLAVALENARLLEGERRRNTELEALRQASLQLTSSLQLTPVLDAILEHTARVFDVENTHIFLYDGTNVQFGTAYWDGQAQTRPFADPRPDGLTYTVARTGHMMVIPNMHGHPIYLGTQWDGSIIGLPLKVGDQVNGVMTLASTASRGFDEHELRVLALLADQAAIAIHNAQMYERVQSHVANLETRVSERTLELRQALQKERRLNDLKSRFVSMVSHEFRTPLAIIQTSGDMLARYGERLSDERKREQVTEIQLQVQRLTELLNDILMWSRADTVGLTPHPVTLGIDTLVLDVVAEVQKTAPYHHVKFVPGSVPHDVDADPKLLRQAISNLISNAVKYSPKGTTVHVETSGSEDSIAICVRDEGIGIPDEDMDRMFEMFHRASNARDISGTGLGLAIVKHIAEAHGGRIDVQSKLGAGSNFTLHLPAAKPSGKAGMAG